jgi:hypothetical protein
MLVEATNKTDSEWKRRSIIFRAKNVARYNLFEGAVNG